MTSDSRLLSAHEASRLIAAGDLTSEALVSSCLERISARESQVQAWAWIDEDKALEEAKERDRQRPLSPLHGIPVGVKDIIDTAQIPTARGSAIYRDRVPNRDADCVASLRRAGAVILGKTVTTEFAASFPGPTRNPLNLNRTPGGSSSGSAAAVADWMVPLSIGSQTSGSIVRPASFCGVFGLKPTIGLWPTAGVQRLAPSLDTLGGFARDYRDLSLLFPHMGGTVMSPSARPGGDHVRIGFAQTPYWDECDPGSASLLLEFLDSLLRSGVIDSEVELPGSFSDLAPAQLAIFGFESARELDKEYTDHNAELSDTLREWLERSRAIPMVQYREALELRMRAGLDMTQIWDSLDVLLTPAVKGEAPQSLSNTGDPLFCRAWTALGGPALALPLLKGPSCLPLGMQLVGPPGGEAKLFVAAKQLLERVATSNH